MSKVIAKIGPVTEHVKQEDIVSISFGEYPKTTIKYAKNHSVVFFDRNPYYVTMTDQSTIGNVCKLLDLYMDTEDTKYRNMALENIHGAFAAYVSQELFDDFSESLIYALKNAKNIGRRQSQSKE